MKDQILTVKKTPRPQGATRGAMISAIAEATKDKTYSDREARALGILKAYHDSENPNYPALVEYYHATFKTSGN